MDHPYEIPLTRRQLLIRGWMGFSALCMLPGPFGMGLRRALAEEDCGGGTVAPSHLPFLVFDMAGGAALPGNFLVGGKGGPEDFLKSYDLLGWNPLAPGALNKDFGLPMSAQYSTLLKGILATASAGARANLRMGSFCHFAQDDVSSNKLNAGTLGVHAGIRGLYISNGLGLVRSNSGGNSDAVLADIALRPTFVTSITDVMGTTNFGGPGLSKISPEQLKTLANGAVNLSQVQKLDYLNLPKGDTLAALSKCAYEKSVEFVNGVSGLDPRPEVNAQAAYGINIQTSASDPNAVAAALAMNTIKGFSGPSVWTLGDCDYHTQSQVKGDMRDGQMGEQIGRAVELAFRLKKPLFFQLLTDGGCEANRGTRNWGGDSGAKCMTVIGYFRPDSPPTYYKNRMQIGFYTQGQGAERTTLIGSDPSKVASAVFANYLAVSGKLKDFSTLLPNIFANKDELDSILIFEPKA